MELLTNTISNIMKYEFNCGFYASRKKLYTLQFKEPITLE